MMTKPQKTTLAVEKTRQIPASSSRAMLIVQCNGDVGCGDVTGRARNLFWDLVSGPALAQTLSLE